MEDKRLEQAIEFATRKHSGQKRKGTSIPYIVHPIETMTILQRMNADTDLMIAGVLHDVVEDAKVPIEDIQKLFGEDVAYLVAEHSEDKAKTWTERKEADIKAVRAGSKRLKMLVMADKLSNLRALYSDYRDKKEKVWERFNAPAPMQAWYYSKMIDAMDDLQYEEDTEPFYREMCSLCKDIFDAML